MGLFFNFKLLSNSSNFLISENTEEWVGVEFHFGKTRKKRRQWYRPNGLETKLCFGHIVSMPQMPWRRSNSHLMTGKSTSLKALTIHIRKKLCFTEFSTKIHRNTRLAVSDVFHVYTIHSNLLILLSYRCLKNVIHHIESINEWLLLSVTFTAKFELIFILAFENDLSESFHFKANRKSIDSSTKWY